MPIVRDKQFRRPDPERVGRRKGLAIMQRQPIDSTDQPDNQEQPAQSEFFRPDESDRLARAKKWLEQARGKTPNEDKGR